MRGQEGYRHSRPHHCQAILQGKKKEIVCNAGGGGIKVQILVKDQEDQTCKDGGDVLELGVRDGRVAKDCNSKHFCEPEA